MASGSAPAFEDKRDHARQRRRPLVIGGPRRRRRFTRLHRDHAQDRVGARSKAWTSARYGTPLRHAGYREGRLAHFDARQCLRRFGPSSGWIAPSSSPSISPIRRRDAAGQGARDDDILKALVMSRRRRQIDRQQRPGRETPAHRLRRPPRQGRADQQPTCAAIWHKSRARLLFFRCSFIF